MEDLDALLNSLVRGLTDKVTMRPGKHHGNVAECRTRRELRGNTRLSNR
jgi:hypothetical protein